MTDREDISMRLELIAAKAKQLANDVRSGRLWEGELGRGLSEIKSQLDMASRDVGQRT